MESSELAEQLICLRSDMDRQNLEIMKHEKRNSIPSKLDDAVEFCCKYSGPKRVLNNRMYSASGRSSEDSSINHSALSESKFIKMMKATNHKAERINLTSDKINS